MSTDNATPEYRTNEICVTCRVHTVQKKVKEHFVCTECGTMQLKEDKK